MSYDRFMIRCLSCNEPFSFFCKAAPYGKCPSCRVESINKEHTLRVQESIHSDNSICSTCPSYVKCLTMALR
jgi:PHP family Zn ribbon phosphoesterase